MARRTLYLHEVIDIVGQGQYEYMEHLRKDPVEQMPDMNSLQGTFFVVGQGGGRWPQVINIWNMGERGWDSWAANVDRLNLKRRKAFYGDWWKDAYSWRTGGYDRVCGSVPGCPTTAEIKDRAIKGTLFVHELLSVRPGAQLDYLARVAEERVPLMREYGHEVTGLYEVVNNAHEVVVVWAASVAARKRFYQNRDAARGLDDAGEADVRLADWERASAELVVSGDAHVMTPLPGTVYGPDDWEEAELADWLAPGTSE